MQRRKYRYYQPSLLTAALSYSTADLHNCNDYITIDVVLEMEDARTEYSLTNIWVKLVHAYTADTRLSSSSPLHALLESLGTRLVCAIAHSFTMIAVANKITQVCKQIVAIERPFPSGIQNPMWHLN